MDSERRDGDLRSAQGVQVGDGNVQNNYYLAGAVRGDLCPGGCPQKVPRIEPLERTTAGQLGDRLDESQVKCRDDAATQAALDGQTAEALAAVLSGLHPCLASLGVHEADLPSAVDQVSRAVLLQFREVHDSVPLPPPPTLPPALRRLVRDIAAYIQPERLLAGRLYFSTSKVVAFHRAYEDHLHGERSATPEQRFLALHRYFCASEQLIFGPARLLPGLPAPDSDQWVFFTGEFTLSPDDGVLGSMPDARQVLSSGGAANLCNIVTAIFGARDPFFYPYVQFTGRVGGIDAAMTASRKHLRLDSHTVGTLIQAIRGTPLTVAGFGTLGPPDIGVLQIHPILFQARWLKRS